MAKRSALNGVKPAVPRKPWAELTDEEFADRFQEKRIARMTAVDSLPPELRALVHKYGLHVVDVFLRVGITKARHIRHCVEVVLDEFSPTRGTSSVQGPRNEKGRD